MVCMIKIIQYNSTLIALGILLEVTVTDVVVICVNTFLAAELSIRAVFNGIAVTGGLGRPKLAHT